MRKCAVLCSIVCAVFFIGFGLQSAPALAGGGGAYPNGSATFFAGMAPPPGFAFINYMMYYHADEFKDNKGKDLPIFKEADVAAEVMRFIWISNYKIFGADYGQHLFVPVINADLDFDVPVGPALNKSSSDHNIPYLIYSPSIFAWHMLDGRLHFVLNPLDLYIPLGNEEGGNIASVGRNFWTFENVFAVTWLPTKQLELSAKFMYDFNTKQDDMPHPSGFEFDRTPGQEFHFDYNVSYAVYGALRLGVGGYFYWQTTDDDYDLGGNIPAPARIALKGAQDDRSKVWAVGPGIWYQHKNMMFEVSAHFETDAENTTEGIRNWFKFIYVF